METYCHDLKDVPVPILPEGYVLHTWQDGAEEILVQIVNKVFQDDLHGNWKSENFIERYFLKPQFKKDGFFLVKYGNDYVGTAFAWQDDELSFQGILHWLAVLPEHRGKGIGRALCCYVLRYHKEHSKTTVSLETEACRKAAIDLYKSIGFTKSLLAFR